MVVVGRNRICPVLGSRTSWKPTGGIGGIGSIDSIGIGAGYCQRAGGVLTAFWTAAAAAAAAALVTPIVTASDERGIMVELVPAKNMFWLRLGVVQPKSAVDPVAAIPNRFSSLAWWSCAGPPTPPVESCNRWRATAMPTGIAALFCVLLIPMWSMAVPRLTTGATVFGEGASNLTTAVSAVVVLLVSKLFDVVTSDTWHGSRLICIWSGSSVPCSHLPMQVSVFLATAVVPLIKSVCDCTNMLLLA